MGRGEARVGDGGAGLERELAEVVRGAEELQQRDGADQGARDEVHLEQQRTVQRQEHDRRVRQRFNCSQFDLWRAG